VGGALGAAGVACLLFLAPASSAATPAPDPPPVTVTPDAKPTAPVRRAPAVTRTVVTPPTGPVVTRTVVTPVIVAREVPARPAATPAQRRPAKPKPKAAVKPKPAVAAKAKPEQAVAPALPPHDRKRVPLARFVPTAEELNRSLVALAGGGLGFVALGGAVVLLAARRQFGGLAR
jgi:hypothetical protein